ncbi:hypothetical protein JQ612_34320 [Bradyrhizobium manausense]|uniref:hypothetical protein n=1 Tax=Bradyrhizobium manausense TaxID=989370 RepID=UPI001BAB56D8|nr:hypothetical protein [Bradyrhizobium manausense]MBR0687601.1 hypothetical protein [Bradyrhizobium manausense]MBR0838301.1 hypothetical protein [Bradyrhizobium manausense]
MSAKTPAHRSQEAFEKSGAIAVFSVAISQCAPQNCLMAYGWLGEERKLCERDRAVPLLANGRKVTLTSEDTVSIARCESSAARSSSGMLPFCRCFARRVN